MTLPKDWSKKPDWLDRASEPSHLGIKERVLIICTVLLLLGGLALAAVFVGSRLF
jgi:hypothetical protein